MTLTGLRSRWAVDAGHNGDVGMGSGTGSGVDSAVAPEADVILPGVDGTGVPVDASEPGPPDTSIHGVRPACQKEA